MKYAIFGFYDHANIGDEMFRLAFQHLLKGSTLDFYDLSLINIYDLSKYEAIIVGGGDLFNDFYGIKFEEVLKNYTGYKIAYSVGFSFEDCLNRPYVNYFDDIFIRNQTDIIPINQIIGSIHTHAIPDMGFSLPLNFSSHLNFRKSNNNISKVGIILVGSILSNENLVACTIKLLKWLLKRGYQLEFFPMYSDPKITDNDLAINQYIYHEISDSALNLPINLPIIQHPALTFYEFISKLSHMDFAISMRFHGQVFCTRLGIPFLGFPLTRKNIIYQNELPKGTSFVIPVERDNNYQVTSFDVEACKNLFFSMIEHKEAISAALSQYSQHNEEYFKYAKLKNYLTHKRKRLISRESILPEIIYHKYLSQILAQGVNPLTDDLTEAMTQIEIHKLADNLCYEITSDPANEYIYGNRINLMKHPYKLRDIVYYIHNHHQQNKIKPRLNLTYLKQNSSKNLHRSGWQFAISSLYDLSDNYGVLCDTYLDRTFGWAKDMLVTAGILPYTNRWIGFIHHTFNEEFSANNCHNMFADGLFINSLRLCQGIYCLSQQLAQEIKLKLINLGYPNILVNCLRHPTEFPKDKFSLDKYFLNSHKKIIHIGYWYRNPITIYTIKAPYELIILKGNNMLTNFCPEEILVTYHNKHLICNTNNWTKYLMQYLNKSSDSAVIVFRQKILKLVKLNPVDILKEEFIQAFLKRVTIIPHVTDEEYDTLLNSNIVFLNLVDASAVNTLLECIVRNTPILINKLPAIVEVLGENYPLYYHNVNEIPELLAPVNIIKTYMYLHALDKECFRLENFVKSLINSEIYQNIKV